MRPFEKNLKMLLCMAGPNLDPIYSKNCPIDERGVRVLSEKCLVELEDAGEGTYYIHITGKGLSYFDDKAALKHEKLIDAVRGFFTSFLAGLFSGVWVTLLLEHVIVPLLTKARG